MALRKNGQGSRSLNIKSVWATLLTLPRNMLRLFHWTMVLFHSSFTHIKNVCSTTLTIIALTLYLLVDSLGNQSHQSPTCSGTQSSSQKKQSRFSQIKVPRLEKCSDALHLCLRICRSFYNLAVKLSIKVLLSFL